MKLLASAALLLVAFIAASASRADPCLEYGSRTSLAGALEIQLRETPNPYGLPGVIPDLQPDFFLRLDHPICTRPSETSTGPGEDGVQRLYLRRAKDSPEGPDLSDGEAIAVEGQLSHGPAFGHSVVLDVDAIRRR